MRVLGLGGVKLNSSAGLAAPAADRGKDPEGKGDRRLGMLVIKKGFREWVRSVARAVGLRKRA